MSKANKKQRHEARRRAKRLEQRRREAGSPVKRLAEAPGEIECWMSDDFDGLGQAQIFVYKRAAGLSGAAGFLVDQGVVGLKDAWIRMQVDRMDLLGWIEESKNRDISMRRVSADRVREMVAGGVRWAHENGMKLPKEWGKPASIFGGVGDWAAADVSGFIKEFAGHPEDLRRRLVAEPFDAYVKRKDVTFVFSEEAAYLDEETDRPIDENEVEEGEEEESILDALPDEEVEKFCRKFTAMATTLASGTSAWLADQNQPASTELVEAWLSVVVGRLLSKLALPDGPEKALDDLGYQIITELGDRIEESRGEEYQKGVGQVLDHLLTNPLMMQQAVERQAGSEEAEAD